MPGSQINWEGDKDIEAQETFVLHSRAGGKNGIYTNKEANGSKPETTIWGTEVIYHPNSSNCNSSNKPSVVCILQGREPLKLLLDYIALSLKNMYSQVK